MEGLSRREKNLKEVEEEPTPVDTSPKREAEPVEGGETAAGGEDTAAGPTAGPAPAEPKKVKPEEGDQSENDEVEKPIVPILYELVGVVVHSGQANAGHYYSFIMDRK